MKPAAVKIFLCKTNAACIANSIFIMTYCIGILFLRQTVVYGAEKISRTQTFSYKIKQQLFSQRGILPQVTKQGFNFGGQS